MEEENQKTTNWLLIGLIAGITVLIIVGLIIIITVKKGNQGNLNIDQSEDFFGQTVEQVSIKGNVHFSALKPEERDVGEIRIYQRLTAVNGEIEEFVDTGLRLGLQDNVSFDWPKSLSGQNYDLMAAVYSKGELIKRSNISTVTAPALNVNLTIAVYREDLLDKEIASERLKIQGKVAVNGYIPENAKLMIYQNEDWENPNSETNKNALIHTFEKVSNGNQWEWDQALSGRKYAIDAVLYDRNNQIIGRAEETLIARQADSEVDLIVNSQAQPPATPVPTPTPAPTSVPTPVPTPTPVPVTKATINGYITLNGPTDANSSLLVLWRHPGENDYQEALRIENPDNNNQYWEWKDARVGQTYEMTVALQVNENNTSTSPQIRRVSAPAQNVNFTLNTNFSVPAPNQLARLDSCANHSGDTWEAKLVIPHVEGAGNYWIQIGDGDKNNPTNLYNKIVYVSGQKNDYNFSLRVKNNQNTWLRYAMSYCINCDNPNNFSGWSPTFEFSCLD